YRMIRQALRTQSAMHDRSVVVRNIAGQGPASWELPEDAIRPELQPGEILLWSGRPRLGFVLNWIEMFSMIGAFIWMVYFHFLFLGGNQQFGFAFLWFLFAAKLLTVAIKVGRAVNDASLRSRTAYGVTTTRAIVVTGGIVRRLLSLSLRALAEMDLSQHDELGGTILIGPDVPRPDHQVNTTLTGRTPSHMLRFDLA